MKLFRVRCGDIYLYVIYMMLHTSLVICMKLEAASEKELLALRISVLRIVALVASRGNLGRTREYM